MDIKKFSEFFANIDKNQIELTHAVEIKDGWRLILGKQSENYELNPNAVLNFLSTKSKHQWRKSNIAQIVQEPKGGWPVSTLKFGTRKKRQVRCNLCACMVACIYIL